MNCDMLSGSRLGDYVLINGSWFDIGCQGAWSASKLSDQ